jgi:hypothetical protein
VYDNRRYSVLLLFPILFRAAFKCLSASADILFSRYATTAKIRLTLHLLFPIFIVGQICYVALRHRFSKERYNFPLDDFIEAEPTDTFAEAVGGDSILEPIEGTRDVVGFNVLVTLIRVGSILQTIHRVRDYAELGVSDCQFDFVQ